MVTEKTAGEQLRDLEPGVFVTIKSRLVRGGSLQARKQANGVVLLYFRYSHGAVTAREAIGPYDPSSPPKKLDPTAKGYSISAALARCDGLGELNKARANTGGLKAARADERDQHQADVASEATAQQASLGRMLEAYVDYLKACGRRSHYDANNMFILHIEQAWPEAWAMPAVRVTPNQIVDMLRRLVEEGKGRTSNKLRSYVRAAYQCAVDVHSLATIPAVFKQFGVTTNPASNTRRDARFDRADKRPLSQPEMKIYWKVICKAPGLAGASLRVHLLSGAQRIEQLVRLKREHVDEDEFTIFDTKGRPGAPARPHQIPMLKATETEIAGISHEGKYVFSTTGGDKPISATTLSGWAQDLVGDSIPGFQLKRVRSGVDTLLASKKVTREDRGHLQSHGISGVQTRHYDGHEYMDVKREALKVLSREIGADRQRPTSQQTVKVA